MEVQYVRNKMPGFVEKGKSSWSELLKISKVLGCAVQLEDGKVRSVYRVAGCKSLRIKSDRVVEECEDESGGYMMGSGRNPTGLCVEVKRMMLSRCSKVLC